MVILSIRTDKPEAEIGLFEADNPDALAGAPTVTSELAYETWIAHHQLSETIHTKIEELLKNQDKNWRDIGGIVCFKGPGSFTGLRIGLSVGNALAGSLSIPVVAESGESWISTGIVDLLGGQNDKIAVPEYGSAAYTTTPRK